MKIEIVENLEKRRKEDNDYAMNALKGKTAISRKKAEKTIIMTPEIFSKVFSPGRVNLILIIRKNKDKNIYRLAKELGRKYEAVHRDIRFLEGFGIIKIRKKERKRIPLIEEAVKMPVFSAA